MLLPVLSVLPFLCVVTALNTNVAMRGQRHELITRQSQVELADGTTETFGTVNSNLSWQATGILYQGCKSSTTFPISITDCYELELSSDPTMNLDPGFPDSPRQRIEFLTPTSSPGTTHQYKWRFYLSSQTGTTTHFFHLMQLFSRDSDGPIITLDAVGGQVAVKDNVRDCTETNCPSIALDDFTDITTTHMLKITFGDASISGSFQYVVKNVKDESVDLLSYTVTGDLGGNAYVKFGTYRAAVAGMTISLAAAGDCVVQI